LLGYKDCGANMSRYERGHRLPSLRTALALAVILDVSVSELFGGLHTQLKKHIADRVGSLISKLEQKHGSGRMPALTSQQLRWLGDHHGLKQINNFSSQ